MPKREVDASIDEGHQAYLKRQKIKHVSIASTAEEIHSARHLQQLLAFDQDAGRASHGILSLKGFLESLGEEDKAGRIEILKEYLQSQIPRDDGDENATYLPDLMQTWTFAAQANNESLLSAVGAVLAQLYRTISGKLDFVDYGLRLGRTLLHKEQLDKFGRCLTGNKNKDYVISPTLRLLRELTTFDGGVLAQQVFRARDSTLRALPRNLSLGYVGDGVEDPRKPSVRTHAVRLFLALLKFLPADSKRELLEQRDVVSAVTRDIKNDPPGLVVEFLNAMKSNILQDDKLTRDTRSKFLNFTNLSRIVTLYGYNDQIDNTDDTHKPIDALTHEFLLLACTSPDVGLLHRQNGFYPRGVNPDAGINVNESNFIDLGLDSLEITEKYEEGVPVRNTTLSEFIRVLRPWSNTKQSELLLAILKAAPELIADYFFAQKTFSFEPKLTPVWIGYSAFLYSALQLPIPEFFGNQDHYGQIPPATSLVIENILPQPLSQKNLVRCLNHDEDLITFFAIRIMVIAFEKFQKVIEKYHEAADSVSALWAQAAAQLTDAFYQRCPPMKDAINAFRTTPETNIMQKQAASKLLTLYYEVIPQVALESKFNVADSLAHALKSMKSETLSKGDLATKVADIENLFRIAQYSLSTRWFNKTDSLSYSPFVAMLSLFTNVSSEIPLARIREIAETVADEGGILPPGAKYINPLVATLKASITSASADSKTLFEFLDNCCLRCATTPIKYLDALEQHAEDVYGTDASQDLSVSLLMLAFAEQWDFVENSNSGSSDAIDDVARMIANYAAASVQVGADKKVIKHIITGITEKDESKARKSGRKILNKFSKLVGTFEIHTESTPGPASTTETTTQPKSDTRIFDAESDSLTQTLTHLKSTSEPPSLDPTGLSRCASSLASNAIDTLIESPTHLAVLVPLLSSLDRSIRLQSLTLLTKLVHAIQPVSGSVKPDLAREQIWLLLSELIETCRSPPLDSNFDFTTNPAPGPLTAFATHALPVLHSSPLHPIYPKLSVHLTKSPSWPLDSIPLFHSILASPPSVDGAYYAEFIWLLDYLIDALRTEDDVGLFYKRKVFERLLGYYNHPYLGKGGKERIVTVLARAVGVDTGVKNSHDESGAEEEKIKPGQGSGALTLITRLSILSWTDAQIAMLSSAKFGASHSGEKAEERRRIEALRRLILERSDGERLRAWSGRNVQDLLNEENLHP